MEYGLKKHLNGYMYYKRDVILKHLEQF